MSHHGLSRVEHLMGTAVSLHLADDLPLPTLRRLADNVFGLLHDVDRRFSTYRTSSEVNRLHRNEIRPEDCSPDLRQVLENCAQLWSATGGSFDVYATGHLDPSGYVKGWAVQVASDRLVEAGCLNHYLNAGGDIRLRGRPRGGPRWRVGIRHPWSADRLCWILEGNDLAIATSGVYERGHHVIDPHRGRPATGLRSVTVIGDDLGLCDAYATAAIAKGLPGIDWLAGLAHHRFAVVTETSACYRSDDLPVASEQTVD